MADDVKNEKRRMPGFRSLVAIGVLIAVSRMVAEFAVGPHIQDLNEFLKFIVLLGVGCTAILAISLIARVMRSVVPRWSVKE